MDQYLVLDTNICIINPNVFAAFQPEPNEPSRRVIMPYQVLKELEKFSRENSERGRNSSKTQRALLDLHERFEGDLEKGIQIAPNYVVQGAQGYEKDNAELERRIGRVHDYDVLKVVMNMRDDDNDVELKTNDKGVLLWCSSLGISASPWEDYDVPDDTAYTGVQQAEVEFATLSKLRKQKNLTVDDLSIGRDPFPNEFVIIHGPGIEETPVCFNQKKEIYEPLWHMKDKRSKVKPYNLHQACLMHALRDPNIAYVFAIGVAGSAKTFLSVDAAIECTEIDLFGSHNAAPGIKGTNKMERALLTRPTVKLRGAGEDLGARPGTLFEKMRDYFGPITDQLELLCSEDYYNMTSDELEYFIDKNLLQILVTDFVRGRSINKRFWLIDEAQNLQHSELLAMVTRVGFDTKMVFCADPLQCDLKGLANLKTNPAIWLNERFKGSDMSATVYFDDTEYCVRSAAAREALRLLQGSTF